MISLMNICKLEGMLFVTFLLRNITWLLTLLSWVFLPILAPVFFFFFFFCPQIQSWTLFLAASSYINLEKLSQTHHSYLPSIGWSSKLITSTWQRSPVSKIHSWAENKNKYLVPWRHHVSSVGTVWLSLFMVLLILSLGSVTWLSN